MASTDIIIPFARHLGIEILEQSRERALAAIEQRPELLNSSATIHGGVLMTLLDFVMCMAVRGYHGVMAPVITVDMSVSFMKSGSGRVVAEGRVLHGATSTTFCEAEVRHEPSGSLLAKAIGTCRLVVPKTAFPGPR